MAHREGLNSEATVAHWESPLPLTLPQRERFEEGAQVATAVTAVPAGSPSPLTVAVDRSQ